MAIAADGHGTPAPAMGAGIVVKEEAAGRIRTTADGSSRTFDEEFRGGAGNCREEPFQAVLAGNKVKGPGALAGNEFVVTFRDAKNFIDGLNPGTWEGFLVHEGSEDGAERLAKAKDAQEHSVDSMGFVEKERAQASSAIFGDQSSVHEERDKFIPREIAGGWSGVSEIEGEATSDELRAGRGRAARSHITSVILQAGYSRIKGGQER